MKDMRRGKFSIAVDMINNFPERVRQIMSRVIVVRVRAECMRARVIEYIALSPEFDKLKNGDVIPEYMVGIKSKKKGNKIVVDKIIFERVK